MARDGTENCDYLIACDLDDTPIPGFGWTSYEQGYGDMRGVVDTATIRYLPWHRATAVVLVRPRRRRRRHTGRRVAAPHPAGPGRAGDAEAGYVPMIGSELEFFLFTQDYDAAHAAGYHGLTANSPYVEDYAILQTSKEEDVLGAIRRGLRTAGFPLEFSKGEAGKGQHEVNLTYQTAVEMADINLLFKAAVKEIAHGHGKSAHVHGQAARRRRRLQLPHPLQPLERSTARRSLMADGDGPTT